jgi:HSP20 family molecular chaperone IbpA
MAKIPVQQLALNSATARQVLQEVENISEEIRNRAYYLAEREGGTTGSDLEYWVRAEREVLSVPPGELLELDQRFILRVALPGADAGSVRALALPNTVIVQADPGTSPAGGQIRFSEFSRQRVCRRFEMPQGIDVKGIAATLDNGILQVVLPKEKPRRTAQPAQKAAAKPAAAKSPAPQPPPGKQGRSRKKPA